MLIYLELVIVSVFLWYAADALFVNYKGYSRPLGFDISHVYHVELATVPQNSTDYDTLPAVCIFIIASITDLLRSGKTP